jgi:hypothetical protein
MAAEKAIFPYPFIDYNATPFIHLFLKAHFLRLQATSNEAAPPAFPAGGRRQSRA